MWSELDFKKTISTTVMCGWDTIDCNGATAGSIMGALRGIKGIPEDMSKPLSDRIRTAMSGCSDLRISDLAKRTFELAWKYRI